jgi:hypothetical protein
LNTSQAEPPASGWIKSSLSFANGNCVEVMDLLPGVAGDLPDGGVLVRNSRKQAQQPLAFTRDEWHAFLAGVRNGEFDRFGRGET